MDFSSIINTLTGSDSVSQLSNISGTSEQDVSSILSSVIPQLLNGAQEQATNEDTATSFANALTSHGQQNTNDLSAFFGGIDLEDGQKIVDHLLGSDNAVATAETLSTESGVASSSITSIISATAPLLMSLLGQQATSETQTQAQEADAEGGFDLSSIVGSLFGGGDDGKEGGGLGSILSGLFK